MTVLERLITTVLTYLNAAGYYKSAEEIENAINTTQLDLYKRLRGNMAQYVPGRPLAAVNPGQNNVSSDAISELYVTLTNLPFTPSGEISISSSQTTRTIDVLLSLEVAYNNAPTMFYPINIIPDNQFLMLKNNPVLPPVETRPIGRLMGLLQYEVLPMTGVSSVQARALTLPTPVAFTFSDSGGPIPLITITQQIDWTADKLDNLVYGTVASLGFNLSNGVLVQSGTAMNEKIL
jgi:hypothetical protein